MEEEGLPSRMFETGFEPTGRKRVNAYFTLRWVESIKPALDEEYLKMLENSQFSRLMQMGKHTFSVCFVHYLLSRQLVTKKKYELWWLFAGKPIRYGVKEFALVTGLNCGSPPSKAPSNKRKRGTDKEGKRTQTRGKSFGRMWKELFGDFKKPTPAWVLDKLLLGRKYKDGLKRFRLALILLVEGLLCPTSGTMYINPEVVEMVSDVENFLQYPWGRKSFLLTVESAKSRTAAQLVQETIAIQGFPHAIVLLTAACCPYIVKATSKGEFSVPIACSVDELVSLVVQHCRSVNIVTAKNLDQQGQASVRSILSSGCEDGFEEIHFADEEADQEVEHMIGLINEDFPFELNSWSGGVKEYEAEFKDTSISDAGDEDGGEDDDVTVATSREKHHSRSRRTEQVSPHGNNDNSGSYSGGEIGIGNVDNIISRVADAVEVRSKSVFATYVTTLKKYIDTVAENLKTDIERFVCAGVHRNDPLHEDYNVDFSEMNRPSLPTQGTSTKDKRVKKKGRNGTGSSRKRPAVSTAGGRVLRPLPGRTTPTIVLVDDNEGEANLNKKGKSGSSSAQNTSSETEVYKSVVCGIGKSISTDGGNHDKSPASPPQSHAAAALASLAHHDAGTSEDSVNEDDLPLSILLKSCESMRTKKDIVPAEQRTTEMEVTSSHVKETTVTSSEVGGATIEFAQMEVAGGFKPFKPPPEEKVRAFRERLTETWKLDLGNGMEVDQAMLQTIFEPTVVVDQKTVAAIVEWIHKRNDISSSNSFVYLTPQFMESLKADFMDFKMSTEKSNYCFRPASCLPQPNRPPLSHALQSLYCPFKVNGEHWVGIIADIKRWKLFVLDCNMACVTDALLHMYLQPLSEMLPFLICRALGPPRGMAAPLPPLSISRVDIGLMCELPALSAVASLVLMELHAAKLIPQCDSISDSNLRVSAINYALHVWETFKTSLI